MMLHTLREEDCRANKALLEWGLVTWTSGNVSGSDPETGLVVIKPSGVMFPDLTPENMVIVNASCDVVEGDLGASSDTASHMHVYNHRPDVMGMVHTHSNYATAFAAAGRSIPVYLTAIADEFGTEIPCAPYARIGGQQIGKAILDTIGSCPAVLMKQHGVFTVGPNVQKALQAAVMVEDVAKTVWLGLQVGPLEPLPAEEIAANFDRYQNRYGTRNASINE